ncbi:MAG: hypothetical protein BGN88_01235 [Clostridiales bacterium 43-6]|nr:MAG: hypothetical protein BGN88_01235 [Clostridiales bacterium 43-6]
MQHCEHCRVELLGSQKRCPLCQNKPVGDPDARENRFPDVPKGKSSVGRMLFAWVAFLSVCAAAICVTINLILPSGGWWSLFVIAGIISLWVDFALILKKRKNLPKNILWQVAVVSLIAFLWDYLTGFHRWSLDYVLPILCSCAMLAMTVVAKVRRMDIQDYILYLVIDCVLGIGSLVFLLTGIVQIIIPSALSFGASLVFLAFLLFFEGKALLAELQRRLHL